MESDLSKRPPQAKPLFLSSMSFFGFETDLPRVNNPSAHAASTEEDVAVYTWGEVSYDTLGDALEETGDDFNDETFGSGPVGESKN
jgi:DNA topoisomerase 2-associated protein PAT1